MAIFSFTAKENSRRIRMEIRRVFLEIWDPIGVHDEPNAQDEYDGYIGRVFELLMRGGSDEQIKEHLEWAVSRIGMNSSRNSDEQVVEALRHIRLN